MYARAVDDAARKLHELRRTELEDMVLAFVALGSAVAVSHYHSPLAVALFVGGVFTAARGARASILRWELVESLREERDAYAIDEVRRAAEKAAAPENRALLAASVQLLLERRGLDTTQRLERLAPELERLAAELADPGLTLDPGRAVECERLLTDIGVSPLLNAALPIEDAGAALARVRAGFTRADL